jgi:cytochrome c-type biogenesis protein CcmH/NrfG
LEAEAALQNAVRLNPGDAEAHFALGSFRAQWGEWKEAAAAFDRGLELDQKDHARWSQAAYLHVWVGDDQGYRRCCRGMLERFAATDEPIIAERTAMACLLLPGAITGTDFDRVQKLAARAVS